jgi:drug/metabolite transporter (DMT)-like permease
MSQPQAIERHTHLDAFAVTTMLVLTVIWGLNTVLSKVSMMGFNPVLMNLLRSTIAMTAILIWCYWRGIAVFSRDGSLKAGLIVGALFGIEFVLIYAGLDLTSASRCILMTNTMPFFVMIGAHFLLGERITWGKLAGIIVAFVGVAVVFLDKLSLPSPEAIYGDFLSLLGGLAWAATTLGIRKLGLTKIAPEKTLLYQLAGAIVVALPFLPFSGALFRNLTWLPVTSLLFQALIVVAITYVVWFWMVARYPATGLTVFTFLSPVFGVMFGGLLLGEPMSYGLFAGLGLVVLGLILVNDGFRRRVT